MISRFVSLVLLASVLLAACGEQPAAPSSTAAPSVGVPVGVEGGGTYRDISPTQLAEMLKSKDFTFINTHIPYEGEIEQTDAFIAFEENGPQRAGDYPEDRSAKIVLRYACRSGRMSTIVATELVNAGYTDVWNLDGGMIAWEKAGYELIQK
jgi:rhodanese-related sulfurtransferase